MKKDLMTEEWLPNVNTKCDRHALIGHTFNKVLIRLKLTRYHCGYNNWIHMAMINTGTVIDESQHAEV